MIDLGPWVDLLDRDGSVRAASRVGTDGREYAWAHRCGSWTVYNSYPVRTFLDGGFVGEPDLNKAKAAADAAITKIWGPK